jgi:hypothetical protein
MVPAVGMRNFVSRLKQVVLPAPFGPINAWIVPRSTSSLTPLTARNPLNSIVKPSVARITSRAKRVPPAYDLLPAISPIRP